jgi:AraC-like DNA-binding protein
MAIVLDLDALHPADRVEAFASTIVDRTVPSRFAVTPHDSRLSGQIEWTHLGGVGLLQTTVNAGQTMVRTEEHVRRGTQPAISLAVRRTGTAGQSQFGVRRRLRRGDLYCTDLTSPFTYTNDAGGTGLGLQVPVDRIGLPVDVIRRGAARLPTSELYHVARNTLIELTVAATSVSDNETSDALGTAATELLRALLATASGDPSFRSDALRQTEFERVRHYVRRHLGDPLLNADAIAAHVGLYLLCRENGIRLEQWIIAQRLDRSIAMLSHPGVDPRSMQAVAATCGFSDPSHFARRFRAAYGVTPRAWLAGERP